MPDFLVLPAVIVAVTLLVAAVGKWRRPDLGQIAFRGAGLPAWISSPFVRRWHPVAELLIGLGLIVLPAPWALLPAIAGAALVTAYLVLVVLAVRAPDPVSCGCFGAEDTAPVSGRTLARNIVLEAAAVGAVVDTALGGTVIARLGSPTVWGWLLGAGLAVAVAVLAVPSGPGVPVPDEEPVPGETDGDDDDDEVWEDYVRTEIPEATLQDPDGRQVPLRGMIHHGAQLLLFLSPGCGSCAGIARDLPRWRARDLPLDIRVVVSAGVLGMPGTPAWVETAMVDTTGDAVRTLGVKGTPGAVLLGADGLLAGGPVAGSAAVRDFYVQIAGQLEEAADVS
ncbi:MauE/DoxX family redox-associated membrane protein [Raineyella sp. LH-20]|uniref:MauE/DoxX family redox-associated membrane protein n=1 Tax=Raineyella sp. LH-20 TaxID=3081204 RepID=UPI002954AAD1|nr:MauE/DoxX family redox-associated membrane protein [Raineyella sp. LH-20]WOP17860.1 MauE/DoxX family redox-associated membrane protein [Raineyella sp. LH-20]